MKLYSEYVWCCKILGVSYIADEKEIKKAYRTKLKKYHPDICKDPEAQDITIKIVRAYKNIFDLKYQVALQEKAKLMQRQRSRTTIIQQTVTKTASGSVSIKTSILKDYDDIAMSVKEYMEYKKARYK